MTKEKENKEVHFYRLDVNVHVESLSEIDKEIASNIISGYDEQKKRIVKYLLNGPVTGVCHISYPLTNPVDLPIIDANTIGDILWDISMKYREIYEIEEESATTKTTPIDERTGLINRNRTDGKYGIWGHDLSDLYFEGLSIHEDGQIEIHIGS